MNYPTVLLSFALIASCASAVEGGKAKISIPTDETTSAVCASQRYLALNGYLNAPAANLSVVELGMWDRVKFEKNGVLDWGKLFASRHGRFSRSLYGAKRYDDGAYLVVYGKPDSFSCVSVSADLNTAHLNEAQCRPTHIVKVAERSLRCDQQPKRR